jgi:hypothetical protein
LSTSNADDAEDEHIMSERNAAQPAATDKPQPWAKPTAGKSKICIEKEYARF